MQTGKGEEALEILGTAGCVTGYAYLIDFKFRKLFGAQGNVNHVTNLEEVFK